MKLKHTKVATLAATLILFGSLVGGVNGAIIMTWEEVSGDVEVTLSGSVTIPNTATLTSYSNGPFTSYDSSYFDNLTSSDYSLFTNLGTVSLGGVVGSFSISNSSTASAFSIGNNPGDGEYLATDSSIGLGDTISPTGKIIFEGQSFTTMFGTSTPTNLPSYTFTGSSSPDVQSVVVIPEPSSVFLLGFGALGMVARRKRTA